MAAGMWWVSLEPFLWRPWWLPVLQRGAHLVLGRRLSHCRVDRVPSLLLAAASAVLAGPFLVAGHSYKQTRQGSPSVKLMVMLTLLLTHRFPVSSHREGRMSFSWGVGDPASHGRMCVWAPAASPRGPCIPSLPGRPGL